MSQPTAPRVPRPARPQRVRVTAPTAVRRPHRPPSVAADLDEQTALGEVYLRSLIRSQLRLALGVVAALALTLGLVPLAFAVVPGLAGVRIVGVPIAWPVLGVLGYPWLVLLARAYVHRAERNEAAFRTLVDPLARPDPRDPADPTDRPARPDPARP